MWTLMNPGIRRTTANIWHKGPLVLAMAAIYILVCEEDYVRVMHYIMNHVI